MASLHSQGPPDGSVLTPKGSPNQSSCSTGVINREPTQPYTQVETAPNKSISFVACVPNVSWKCSRPLITFLLVSCSLTHVSFNIISSHFSVTFHISMVSPLIPSKSSKFTSCSCPCSCTRCPRSSALCGSRAGSCPAPRSRTRPC